MGAPLTPDELHRAWQAMRTRPCLRAWPPEFADVMADPLRAHCVALEAAAARRRALALANRAPARYGPPSGHGGPLHTGAPQRMPPRTPAPMTDLKRAAAGERADD